jgi:predicted enzyme related to lactoylglutathione lyase
VGLFGWETEDTDMGGGVYRLLKNSDMDTLHLGGMCAFPPGMPPHPAWLMYVIVGDLDAALSRVREAGGQVINGPMSVGGADRVAQCMDPQGAAFALHARG